MARFRRVSLAPALSIMAFIVGLAQPLVPAQATPEQGPEAAQAKTDLPAAPQYFPIGSVWSQDISQAPVDPKSASMIDWLAAAGGWGTGKLRVDFSIRVLQADASTPLVPFRRAADFYEKDSDIPSRVPLPVGGGMEAEPGYDCPNTRSDRNFIVVDRSHAKLYEAWQANYSKGAFSASSFVIWDLNRIYPPSGRGDQCGSADAAGFPIAPLLFNADEIAAGTINHAIRFTLPIGRIRSGVFVHPATHAGGPSGPDAAPPYGARFRLKASYDVSSLPPAAQVVAHAMQRYGMFISDAGNIALTAQNDIDTKAKYSELGFDTFSLQNLKVTDFEIVKMEKPIDLTYECVRNR